MSQPYMEGDIFEAFTYKSSDFSDKRDCRLPLESV